MAIVKAVTSFLRNHGKSRFPLRCMCSGNPYSFPFPLQPPLSHPTFVPSVPLYVHRLSSSRSLFPLSGWKSMSGPLFLLSPAWKLSQTATPVYLRGGEAIFPRDLLQERLAPIISKSYSDVLNGGGWKITVEEETISVNERFFNLPNMISIGRMVSGPVIGWMIINEFYLYAFCGLAISGATDWLDGFVARKMNINSVMGSYLDPLADKVLIGCVAVAMVKKDLLNPGLVGLILSRDVALVGGAAFKRASTLGWNWRSWSDFANLDDAHKEKVEPLLISKINTVLQLLLVAVALLQPEFGSDETNLQLTYLSCLVASTTVASFAAYMKQYLYRRK